MAWTELHDTLPDHPKTKLLMAELGSTKAHAVGLLCALWCFTLRYGKEGSISLAYWKAFAGDMGESDPDGTLCALRNAGWVERNVDDTAVTCHDWDDYAGRLEDYRKANRERQRRHRLKMRDVTPDNNYVTRDVTPKKRESHTTVPTQPNSTNKTTSAQKRAAGPSKPVDPDAIQLPDDLKSHRAPITEFIRWRQLDKRKPVREGVGLDKFLQAVRKCLPNVQAAVDKAIANDWQGLFPVEASQKPNRNFLGSANESEKAKYGDR